MILMIVAEMVQGAYMAIGIFDKQGSRDVALLLILKTKIMTQFKSN